MKYKIYISEIYSAVYAIVDYQKRTNYTELENTSKIKVCKMKITRTLNANC